MKLFQKLLLAPAALGLFAPIAANANESNFRDVTSYTQDQVQVSLDTFKPLTSKNPLLAGGEGNPSSQNVDFDADTFSATTTASFTSNFAVGKQEGGTTDPVVANFDYEIALSSSFTGNDSLDVVMKAGKSKGYTELDMRDDLALKATGISYTVPLGDKVTASVGFGDDADGSALYNTACVYGAQADTFTNCGVSSANIDEDLGMALGANFDLGNGFSLALGYEGQAGAVLPNTSDPVKGTDGRPVGLGTKHGVDALGGQLAYAGDAFGLSVSWANIENHSDSNVIIRSGTSGHGQTQSVGFNAYYTPELSNFPSISAGFERNHDDSAASASDETTHYFVGLQWDDFLEGSLGAAIGSKAPYAENADALTMYEVFYSYEYADGITITPLIFSKDNTGTTADETGVIVKSTFSF